MLYFWMTSFNYLAASNYAFYVNNCVIINLSCLFLVAIIYKDRDWIRRLNVLSRAVVWKFSWYLFYKWYLKSNKEHLLEGLVDVH